MASRPLRVRRAPEEAPNRSGSNRGDNPAPRRSGSNRGDNPASNHSRDGPTRGVTRNKSLPLRKPSGDDDTPKRRTGRKEPSARGVNRVRSGGFAIKGRRAPSERTTSSGSNITGTSSGGRTGSRANPPESPGMSARTRKVATPVVNSTRPPIERSRGSARTSDPNKTRSKSADANKKMAARRANREANNKGRRTPSSGNVMQPPLASVGMPSPGASGRKMRTSGGNVPPSAPIGMASPGAAGRKIRRAAPEKRGIAPSKSLPSEQIRRVERIRQGQNQKAAGYYRAPPRRKQEESSSSEEESSGDESSSEQSSSSESSVEPTESHRGEDFHDSDYDSDVDIVKPPKNEEQQDGLHYSGDFDFDDDDDDVSFGPPPQVGGRVVYPGGIVVEDASDSECEWEHLQPSRNRKPDLRNGDDWLQPVASSYGSTGSSKRSSTENTSSSASSSSKKSSSRTSSKSSTKRSSKKKSSRSGGGSGTGKVRRPDAGRQSSDGAGGRPVLKPRTGRRSRSSSNERPLHDGASRQSRGENQRSKGRHSPMRTHSDDDVVENGQRVKRSGSDRKQPRPVRRGGY